jgi:hypothetical protein
MGGFPSRTLDGSGYPFHLKADKLSLNARIMAVADIFTALAEERPYRQALEQPVVLQILNDLCDQDKLDCRWCGYWPTTTPKVVRITQEKQAQTKDFYEREFSPVAA